MSTRRREPVGPAAIVDAAITSRQAIRAFLPDPVPQDVLEDILRVASRAPSGTNIQPWNVYVLTGAALSRLSAQILAIYDDAQQLAQHTEEYQYYPQQWVEPYLGRRRKIGADLYALLGIGRNDKDRMRAQWARNYRFFDAPVGLIFFIDRALAQGSWLDYGMFLQNIMVAARARGLDTCPQAAFIQFHDVIRKQLGIDQRYSIVCGMSLGRADMSFPENALATERQSIQEFVHFVTDEPSLPPQNCPA